MTWFFMVHLLDQLFEKTKEEVTCPFKGRACPIQTDCCG